MNRALVFLLLRSVRGRIVRALRLLKQPKYLVGVVVFILWIVAWVGGPLLFDDDQEISFRFGAGTEIFLETMADLVPAGQLALALAMALLVSLWWLVPWSRIALDLTESEIHLLAPMPIARRSLIQYATLKTQPGILIGCIMMTAFAGAGGPLDRLRWFVSFWIVLGLWDLHAKGRSLFLARQKEASAAARTWGRAILLMVLAAYWAIVGSEVSVLANELLGLRPAPGQEVPDFLRATVAAYGQQAREGPLGWMLLPFLWLTAPFAAMTPGAGASRWLGSLVPVLSLLAVHNEWVVRSKAKFEEAALARARREARKRTTSARYWKTSLRSRRRAPFHLAPRGAAEIAVVWKNLMMARRTSLRTVLLAGLLVLLAAAVLPLTFGAPAWVHFVLMLAGALILMISPVAGGANARNDLRSDLLHLETLRCWPIPGWKLFAAESAAPAIGSMLAAAFGAGLLLVIDIALTVGDLGPSGVTVAGMPMLPESLADRFGVARPALMPLLLLSLMPLVAAVSWLSAALQNLTVLFFPGWVHLGKERQPGAAAFGQNIVMFLLYGLVLLFCLLPAVALVALIVLVQVLLGIPVVAWEFPILGTIAATPVAVVTVLVIRGGGALWDRLDPSREILQGAA